MAGYSGKPLPAKLGIKEGFRISLIGDPAHFRSLLGPLPAGVEILGPRSMGLDLIHLFAASRVELTRKFAGAKRRMKPDGALWVSWPKLTSAMKSDLNENIVRQHGLEGGLVDVKVAAIDEDWSGLKFVYRLKDRPTKRRE